jgi:hypothetical protein
MSARVVVYGDNLIDQADELTEEAMLRGKEGMDGASNILVSFTKRLLQLRSGPDAAPVGEPPAYQAGDLSRSVKRVNARVRGRVVIGGVRVTDPGAALHEYGGTVKGKTRMARPFIRPALEFTDALITAHLQASL